MHLSAAAVEHAIGLLERPAPRPGVGNRLETEERAIDKLNG
jgi:hypothetical protein